MTQAESLRAALARTVAAIDDPARYIEVNPHYRAGWIDALSAVRDDPALAAAPPAEGLDEAWAEVTGVLPKSKGRWGYSISGLTYGKRGWCAVAEGNISGEHAEAFGATPTDALRSLASALRAAATHEEEGT